MEGGRVSHSWCMVVVSHGYGGLDGGGGWYACGTKPRGLWLHVGRCLSSFRVQGDDIRSHRLPGTHLWVGSSRY